MKVSETTTCTSAVAVGGGSVVSAQWVSNRIVHPIADPLRCVIDEDIGVLQLQVSSLPTGTTIVPSPQGTNFTSTAQVNGTAVVFTLPTLVKTESWTVMYDPPGSPPGCQIWVKLKRTTPP